MVVQKRFYIIRPERDVRFDVGGAVPTIFLLLAELAGERSASDWREFWKHPSDPFWSIGWNWPRGDLRAASFLRNDLERALGRGYMIHDDILALGKLALEDLPDTQKKVVAAANSTGATFETQHRLPANKRTVVRVSSSLPENFTLPFVRQGTLVFQSRSVRLVGLEFLAELESSLADEDEPQ